MENAVNRTNVRQEIVSHGFLEKLLPDEINKFDHKES